MISFQRQVFDRDELAIVPPTMQSSIGNAGGIRVATLDVHASLSATKEWGFF